MSTSPVICHTITIILVCVNIFQETHQSRDGGASLSWTQLLKEDDVKSLPGRRACHACDTQTAPDAATDFIVKEDCMALADGLLLLIH